LLHFAELCTTTLHTWPTTADALDYSDTLILDLDPFNLPFSTVQQVALVAKDVLDELQLRGYIKTSGATGLHIVLTENLVSEHFGFLIADVPGARFQDLKFA
jgi:bifunctional non-homologous end joining protein LigD